MNKIKFEKLNDTSIHIELNQLENTQTLALAFGKILTCGDVLCLMGDLGAGKTTFSQFLCEALGVKEYVTSPTFNIMNHYDGRIPVYHFDVYRILDPEEMMEIGFDEYLYGKGVCLIEWANLVADLIPKKSLWMTMHLNLDMSRNAKISGPSQWIDALLSALNEVNL